MSNKISSLDDFLLLLKGVKAESAGQYKALCPGHEDTDRSLSVKQADGKLLIKCFAGCETANILKALNLTLADLFLNGHESKPQPHQIEAVYQYDGFEVVRTRPKGFYQRRPDTNGGYIYDLKGITPGLYHQEELAAAIASDKTIYITEGEKDVETLRALGLIATTNPGGALKWRSEYSTLLTGARVVILVDKDQAGQRHGQKVANALIGIVVTLKVLALPGDAVNDVTDWVQAGGTPAELEQLVAGASEYSPRPVVTASTVKHKTFNLTDLGNAERLVDQFGQQIRYCYIRKSWLVWNGKAWVWDSGDRIEGLAKQTVRNIYHEAANETDKTHRDKLVEHAKRSESSLKIKAMINLAQSEPGIPVVIPELDKDPWLFNCVNGTVDLKNGKLLTHRKEDLITVVVPVEYRPKATCRRWLKFLDQVTADDSDLRNYLQRAVGYSLTGNTKIQALFFLFGLGLNGKSTFVTTIRKIVGDYGERVNTDLFMARDRNSSGPKEGLANLRGKRFVTASELEDGRRLAISLIKDMTGGESIKADRKYEHEIEFSPTHKIWLSGNHKPVIPDTTLSIWRRVKLIPFTVTIAPKAIDPDLPLKLEAELPGILTWAVKGCRDWQRHGLKEPDVVSAATADYRHDQDILGDFLEDCCVLDLKTSISKAELKVIYKQWCEDTNIDPVTTKTFKTRLTEKGITEGKSSDGKTRIWRGIRTKNDDGTAGNSDMASDASKLTDTNRQVLPETSVTKGDKDNFMEKPVSDVSGVRSADHEAVLGMTVEAAIELWRSTGAPAIDLGPGETCSDLAILLSRRSVPERQMVAVRTWIDDPSRILK